jgi:hypothetical protein
MDKVTLAAAALATLGLCGWALGRAFF